MNTDVPANAETAPNVGLFSQSSLMPDSGSESQATEEQQYDFLQTLTQETSHLEEQAEQEAEEDTEKNSGSNE